MRLVVVESPTKARTIRRFLPEKEYRIEASMGHIRDLPASAAEIPAQVKSAPWARLGVNVEEGFEPLYVVPSDKKKIVRELKAALKDADELYIATDEDREGESIGWHLLEVLQPKVAVRRMVFHEITQSAITAALENTREIDQDLVNAQETRRILDRLVGYSLSPLLWRKIRPKLSAGRVQSVAVRLLVNREKERIRFVVGSYWDLKAILDKDRQHFTVEMTHLGGQRLATGRDFDEQTGQIQAGKKVLLLGETEARQLAERLPQEPWRVTEVEEKTVERKAYPPFITSTLQQEANRKLNLSARQTMRIAQRLYEQGLITYMRTDSTNLSAEAISASRQAVEARYGREYLSPKPRQFKTKSRAAQEAHEAIRPSGTEMKTKQELGLDGQEGALYDLIWKRTVATQMANARLRLSSATIVAGEGDQAATFRASGRRIAFAGFFRAYVEGSDDPEANLENQDRPLPTLVEGETLGCQSVEPIGHETKPPARYTEATLVKALEQAGIGRPSTYASILETIVGRGYVKKRGRQLVPSFVAFATNNLLEHHFEDLVDVTFTARMEQMLDDIAEGSVEARPYLHKFYSDDEGLSQSIEKGLDAIDAREMSMISFPKWDPFVIRVGRFGPYIAGEIDGNEMTAPIPEGWVPDEVTAADLEVALRQKESGETTLGTHPESGEPIWLKQGPYGFYVQLGDTPESGKKAPKRMSLPKGMEPEQVDLPIALGLLALPRVIGPHPETQEDIKANIGRYGPYVQHQRIFASLTDKDDVLTVDLDRALALLATKTTTKEVLRTLGPHPETGEPIEVLNGRYGPYVKHQKLNASLKKDMSPDTITLEQALVLLTERASRKGRGRRRK